MHVLMAVAEFERSLIVERVRAGQAAARVKAAIVNPGSNVHFVQHSYARQ